jgi:hypothetical protein
VLNTKIFDNKNYLLKQIDNTSLNNNKLITQVTSLSSPPPTTTIISTPTTSSNSLKNFYLQNSTAQLSTNTILQKALNEKFQINTKLLNNTNCNSNSCSSNDSSYETTTINPKQYSLHTNPITTTIISATNTPSTFSGMKKTKKNP